MKTKFTPGPWRTNRLVSDKPTIHTVQADIHQTLARLGEVDGRDGDVHKANAQLIAAAPDMYEALLYCMYRHNNFEGPDWEGDMLGDLVKSALKKARGESETK